MEKLAHRIGIATASLAVATGALFAAGGSASAAAFPADTPTPAQSGVVAGTGATGWNHGGYGGVRSEGYRHRGNPSDGHRGRYAYDRFDRFYPWVWDQLTELRHVNGNPSDGHRGRYAYDRFDRFYPWVWDQLAELRHVN